MFIKHYAPNCLTLTLLDPTLLVHDGNNSTSIRDLFYQKGNSSKMGDNSDEKEYTSDQNLIRSSTLGSKLLAKFHEPKSSGSLDILLTLA